MSFRAVLLIIACLLGAPTPAAAQAFGISADMEGIEAGVLGRVRDTLLIRPPEPNDLFDAYAYRGRAGEDGTICSVSGATPERREDRFGHAVRGDYARLRGLLADKYGPGLRIETLAEGSPWWQERDWILGLTTGEREHRTEWVEGLPDGLRSIALLVRGTGIRRGRVTLTYEFDVGPACGQDSAVDYSGL